jgi:hypothetical protein
VATNAAAIGGALRRYRATLDEWQALVDAVAGAHEAAGAEEAARPEQVEPASVSAIERRLAETAALAAEPA